MSEVKDAKTKAKVDTVDTQEVSPRLANASGSNDYFLFAGGSNQFQCHASRVLDSGVLDFNTVAYEYERGFVNLSAVLAPNAGYALPEEYTALKESIDRMEDNDTIWLAALPPLAFPLMVTLAYDDRPMYTGNVMKPARGLTFEAVCANIPVSSGNYNGLSYQEFIEDTIRQGNSSFAISGVSVTMQDRPDTLPSHLHYSEHVKRTGVWNGRTSIPVATPQTALGYNLFGVSVTGITPTNRLSDLDGRLTLTVSAIVADAQVHQF